MFHITTFSRHLAILVLLASGRVALAGNSVAIPCAVGSGSDNGCSYCDNDLGIEVKSWDQAKIVPNFDFPDAGAKSGGGYDVWWNIAQPADGCRVLLFEPSTTEKGPINPKKPGNVILSVGHGGCYFAHVSSQGVAAGACCGDDCQKIGSIPGPNQGSKRRSLSSSRITRAMADDTNARPYTSKLEARQWRNGNPNQPAPQAAPPQAAISCSAAIPIGTSHTKSGAQQVNGDNLSCTGGASCDISHSFTTSVSTSVSAEKSTTLTTTDGVSVSATAGVMFIGPMATVTVGYNHDWAKAVADSTGTSTSDTVTNMQTFSIGLVPGPNFNAWWAPTMDCQSYKMTCNGAEVTVEKCSPVLDAAHQPSGAHGIMVVG